MNRLLKFQSLAIVGVLTALACWQRAAPAATIANIYNTGVSGGVALVGTGVADPNYSLIISPAAATAVTVNDPGYPIGPWMANNSGSRWIGPSGNAIGPSGNYRYRTTFTLPPTAILSSVIVSGEWGIDDSSIDILINGISTGSSSLGYTPLTGFSISGSGLFVVGTNTLDFDLNNSPFAGPTSPTGLRVDKISGTYQTVPEPATLGLMGISLLGSVAANRRRRPQSRVVL